jgi:phosphoglycolate phosphatase
MRVGRGGLIASSVSPILAAVEPLVLFDVDGTLLLTGGAGMRAMHRAAVSVFGEGFSWEGVVVSGHLDPLIFAEAARRNGFEPDPERHAAFRAAYLAALPEELARSGPAVRPMPGIPEVLDRLAERKDVAVGLLTGNYREAIPIKLAAIGLSITRFEPVVSGEEAPTRPDLVTVALRKQGSRNGAPPDPGRTVIVGDTPRDVECGRARGCLTFAVATGRYDVEALAAAGADVVVPDLADPTALLDLVDRLRKGRDIRRTPWTESPNRS